LIRDKGNVHFDLGNGDAVTLEQRAILSRSNDFAGSIDVILSVDDYGGKESTLLYLARAMEPRWTEWWGAMSWGSFDELINWRKVCRYVIGQRQYAWIAAQHARFVSGYLTKATRAVSIKAIESTETWAMYPTEINRRLAEEVSGDVQQAVYEAYPSTDGGFTSLTARIMAGASAESAETAALSATMAAAGAAYVCVRGDNAIRTISDSVNALANSSGAFAYARGAPASYVPREAMAAARQRLCELTKQLITPSLVDVR